jgi:predicted transcriptional regulator
MSDKESAKKRIELLKQLREKYADTVAQTQERLKSQQAIRKQINQALKEGPKTVPEVALATDLPSDQVLWHITAMKKYDLVEEVGMSGEYYQYQLAQEKSK